MYRFKKYEHKSTLVHLVLGPPPQIALMSCVYDTEYKIKKGTFIIEVYISEYYT